MAAAVKEIRFIYFILCVVGIEVELSIVVKTDNVGAMFLTQISLTGVRRRLVDSRYHFVCENVNSSENDSDIFTKYVSQETYKRHAVKFLESLKILGVNERFGPGRVLEISLTFIQKLVFICIGYPLGMFESEN
jgi:hypothetical protein